MSLHEYLQPVNYSQALATSSFDPFDTLPLKMSPQSKHLLQYFQDLNIFGTCPEATETRCFSAILHSPAALRDVLLVSGMHYVINTKDTKTYNSTFLFHKIETIRQINERLRNKKTEQLMDVTRRIVTLCLVECTLGNQAIAETHFEGLIAFLCTYQSADERHDTQAPLNEELTYRYLIL
ncbi:unnamed protein product [Clonostachys chloroleuca]|uniref:Uncharacterized protein n=1 Tax=Clonostachys chloroleuca TaxID=1926264 RepID=A0AA35M8U1_9HYPO|nr:unnamed protein product [Clonostachys chloroleuca]